MLQADIYSNCTNGTGLCFEDLGAMGAMGTAEAIEALSVVDWLFSFSWLPYQILCGFILVPWSIGVIGLVINWVTVAIPTLLFNRRKTMPLKKLPTSVWTIHGKKYDLTAFAKDHPGGPWALELGRNRDCTGLFESYHMFVDPKRLASMLKRFEIEGENPQGENPQSSPQGENALSPDGVDNETGLIFGDPFHEDVKQMLRKHFKGKSFKMKPWWAVLCISVVLGEAYSAYQFFQGSNIAMFVLPVLGWLLTCNVAHDGSHFAVSKKPWLNRLASNAALPMSFPSTCWHIQHVIQHHVYTNDESDVDLYHLLPIVRVSRATQWCTQFQLQMLSVFLVLPTAVGHLMYVVPMDLLTGQIDAITGTKRYQQCSNLEDFVVRHRKHIIFEFMIPLLWLSGCLYSFGLREGLFRAFISYGLSSYLFMTITQGAHLQEECMVGKEDLSWAKRQARTSLNFKADSTLWLFFTGGLNLQSLHHVAPAIGSSHLADVWPEYKKICQKHDVELKEVNNIGEFFCGFLAWISMLSKDDPHADSEKRK